MNESPIQKILFGSPGTGKSYSIENEYFNDLKIDPLSENSIKTVFHPEYTYGDFMGKLIPLTLGERVKYTFYEGHFLKALGMAFKNILKSKPESSDSIEWSKIQNVALVIDEINRGNSASIFGTAFQLLDRNDNGWSSYSVDLTEIEFYKFIELVGVKISTVDGNLKFQFPGDSHFVLFDNLHDKFKPLGIDIKTKKIRLPPNLSILGTMNTSDNSIYFMDNAFKRRWDWEFVSVERGVENVRERQIFLEYDINIEWVDFVNALNKWIVEQGGLIRKIEDKQIGYWFIKSKPKKVIDMNIYVIENEKIKNKLMFFLWDSVFSNRKEPLAKLLEKTSYELVTFGQFINEFDNFMDKLIAKIPE